MVTSESTNMVHVISASKNEVVDNILVGARPREVAFTPDGRWAYISCEVAGQVVKLDVETRQIVKTVKLRKQIRKAKPKGLRLSHDAKVLYVSTGRGSAIAVLDADSLAVQAVIPVGKRVWGLALSSDGSRLYSANGLDNTVSVIDTEKNQEINTIAVGERPWGLALDD